jgi:hypothetical protein
MAEFWASRREFFMPAYRDYRDAEYANRGGGYTLGYGVKPEPTADAALSNPIPVAPPESAKE